MSLNLDDTLQNLTDCSEVFSVNVKSVVTALGLIVSFGTSSYKIVVSLIDFIIENGDEVTALAEDARETALSFYSKLSELRAYLVDEMEKLGVASDERIDEMNSTIDAVHAAGAKELSNES